MPYTASTVTFRVAEQISQQKYWPDRKKSLGRIQGVHTEPHKRASVFALVEVRLLRVSTARALDDNIRGIATSPHAVFNALALNQL